MVQCWVWQILQHHSWMHQGPWEIVNSFGLMIFEQTEVFYALAIWHLNVSIELIPQSFELGKILTYTRCSLHCERDFSSQLMDLYCIALKSIFLSDQSRFDKQFLRLWLNHGVSCQLYCIATQLSWNYTSPRHKLMGKWVLVWLCHRLQIQTCSWISKHW